MGLQSSTHAITVALARLSAHSLPQKTLFPDLWYVLAKQETRQKLQPHSNHGFAIIAANVPRIAHKLPIAMLLIAAGVVWFAFYNAFDMEKIMDFGHMFEMIAIACVFAIILIPNIIRMWYFTIIKPGRNVSFMKYVTSLGEFFIHMFTQKRALGCDDNQTRWFEHFILVIGYLTLLFTTVFLDWFGSQSYFVIILGYAVSIIIFVVTFDFVLGRVKKTKEVSKYSQPSDWFFVIWLLLMGFTAFAVRLFIDLDILENNKWLYLVHLTILVQWALLIVPFGKWSHFLYRSFAMYFAKLTAD